MLNALVDRLERILLVITLVVFLLLIGVVLLQVVSRYALSSAPLWTEELARFLLIYLVAFGCGIAARHRELVQVDLVLNILPPRLRLALLVVIDAVIIAFCVIFFSSAIDYVKHSAMQNATTLPISMAWITSAVLLIAVNLALFSAANLLRDAGQVLRGETA